MIDISQMGNFAQIRGNSATIYNQEAGRIQSGGTYKGPLGALRRTEGEEKANNAARSELLVALSKTYGMTGTYYERKKDGRIKFSENFVADLKEKIGVNMAKTLKLDSAFEMNDGYVVCGKPLTERRISAVNAQMRMQQASDMKKRMKGLGLDLGRINMNMIANVAKSKTGVDQFIEDLIGITGGDPDLVTEETVASAVRSSYGKVHQWNKFTGDVKDPFASVADDPTKKSADDEDKKKADAQARKTAMIDKIANVVKDAKTILQARGGLRTENTGSIKQLSKTFGSTGIQYMTMTEEMEGIKADLMHVFDPNPNEETSFEGDLNWLADECFSRQQEMVLEGKTVTKQSLLKELGVDTGDERMHKNASIDLCKRHLAAFFTTVDPETKQPVFDEAGERMFCRIMHSGNNYPEYGIRDEKKGSAQFLYMPIQGNDSEGHLQAQLSRLPDGHYRLDLTRTLTKFNEITEFKDNMTLKYDEHQDVKNNFYSYSVAYEFYKDEAGKPVVQLCSAPKMAWRFVENPVVGATYDEDPAYVEHPKHKVGEVFVE